MSLPVTISLNADKHDMFFLTSGKLHLTFENPGPVEVDPDSFNPVEKQEITRAAYSGVLHVVNPNKQVEVNVETQEPVKSAEPIPVQDFTQEPPNPQRKKKVAEVNDLLKKSVKGVKQALAKTDDILFVRLVLEQEKKNKSRKSVLSAASERLTAIQNQVTEELNKTLGPAGQDSDEYISNYSLRKSLEDSRIEFEEVPDEKEVTITTSLED